MYTPIWRKSHVFVLLSDWEGLPISIIEAMRIGLPIVATNVGGVKELVVDHGNGFLVEREDKELLKQRLRHLLLDATLSQKNGQCE
ncbi:glycosyltransferase [Lysinibacillus sp. MHQ-1]|nr:glycosyltransferase [Lysinibacillus sp. MHQ-1]